MGRTRPGTLIGRKATVMMLTVALLAVAAVAAGVLFGWQWVLGPLLGVAVWMSASATLRSLANTSRGDEDAVGDAPVDAREAADHEAARGGSPEHESGAAHEVLARAAQQTLYRCEQCGAELLVLVPGEQTPPRHCGRVMHRRTEVLN